MKKMILALCLLASSAWAIDGIPTMNSVTKTSYTVTTHTATVICLSQTANLGSLPLSFIISTRGAGTGIYWDVYYSATTTNATVANLGNYTAASSTASLLDKLDPNLCLAIIGAGSASSTVWLNIFAERK